VDIVSKNGNMLLNIPIKGDGTVDEVEVSILEEIASWMDVNKESIFDTRPWIIYGEGPSTELLNPVKQQGFNEGKTKFSGNDIRFNQKGKILYVTTLGVPDGKVVIKALGKNSNAGVVKSIQVLGSNEKISWQQASDSLIIENLKTIPNEIAVVFKIQLK
jgi:alpha-L-fucosidase